MSASLNKNERTELARVDETFAAYLRQLKSRPLLTAEEEKALAKAASCGNTAAKEKLVEGSLRLVIKVAQTYKASGASLLDLIQEGNLGLLHAAEKFDWRKNIRFSTYAVTWIRQSILRYLENNCRAIRLPARREWQLRKMNTVFHSLCQSLQRIPTNSEVAQKLGIKPEDAERITSTSGAVVSLDAETDSERTAPPLEAAYQYSPDNACIREASRRDTLNFLKTRLASRERQVILYRFQFIPGAPHSLRKIGEELGISTEAVRQIEKRAISKIQRDGEALRNCVYAP